MKTFVINVKARPERLAAFWQNNAAFERSLFTITEAVTPDMIRASPNLPADYFAEIGHYCDTAVAVALSHIKLWEFCIQSGEPITILEDDVVLGKDFFEQRSRIVSSHRFDLLAMGFNTDWPVEIDFGNGLNKATLIFSDEASTVPEDKDVMPQVVRADSFAGASCYALTPEGAQKLRDLVVPLRSRSYPLRVASSYIAREFQRLPWINSGIDVDIAIALRRLDAKICLPPIAQPINDWNQSSFDRKNHGFINT